MLNDRSININNRNEFVEGVNDVIQSWAIILKTIPGSIPFLPTFGSGMHLYIDKPINMAVSEMINRITTDLETWEKRVRIKKIETKIENEKIIITIFGTYTSTGESIIAQMDLTKIFGSITNPVSGIGYDIIGSTLKVY